MADYYQLKNQNIFNPPANTDMGNVNSQFNTMYVQNALVLGNVSVTGTTIIAPRVSSIAYPGNDTAADTAGGQTITLNGTGFVAGASVLINGSAVGVVSVVSSTVITFTSPANTTGSYVVYVVNPDGSTAIAIPGIQYSGTPTWTTAAGTLGNVYETNSFNQTVTATGDAPITYSVVSGSLPPGSTFNANGTITGTSQLSASPTTYSFTVRATDAEQQDTNRAFSIAVIPDVVTWSSPTNNATYTPAANIAIANITLSATSAVGSGITYSANTLPTGLSLTGANISGTPTVQANTSSLLTATANTTSESSSITINWVVSVASDPYFMYNTLLLPGNGTNGAQNNTFLDGSTNNFTVTRYGNTTQGTFSPYGPNWSNYFDGTGDYLTIPASTILDVGNTSWTIECWVYMNNTTGTQMIVGYNNLSPTDFWDLTVVSGVPTFKRRIGGSEVAVSGGTISANIFTNVTVVRNGTAVTIYLNGSSVATNANVSMPTSMSDQILGIGANRYSAGYDYYFNGFISNLRMVKGTAVYTSNFTPSTTPLTAIANTSLLTCQSNRFIDNSSNAFTITVFGNTNVQRFSPFSPGATYSTSTIGGSGYFDGSGDYLTTSSSSDFTFTGNFTIEMWVYLPNGYYQQIQRLVTSAGPTGYPDYNSSAYFSIGNDGGLGPGKLCAAQAIGTANPLLNDTIGIPINQWVHIALVRNGSAVVIYKNGVSVATATNSGTWNFNYLNAGIRISGSGWSATEGFQGYMSNLRMTNTAVYTAAFTPPTSPVTAIANTSLLANFTNAGIIDNTMINTLETVGNAQISTAQSQFGGGSMSFDGTGDYMIGSAFSNPIHSIGSGDFTIEMWLYTNANKAQILIDTGTVGGSTTGIQCALNASGYPNTVLNNSIVLTSSILVSTTTWTHVAWVRSSGTLVIYVNGVSGGSVANSINISDTGLTIGTPNDYRDGSSTYHYNGYIDDLRITKGVARYTTTFTPPTSAFPTY